MYGCKFQSFVAKIDKAADILPVKKSSYKVCFYTMEGFVSE